MWTHFSDIYKFRFSFLSIAYVQSILHGKMLKIKYKGFFIRYVVPRGEGGCPDLLRCLIYRIAALAVYSKFPLDSGSYLSRSGC